MRIAQFIELFCSFFNYEKDELEQMVLWPKQRELCDLLDTCCKLFWPKARQVGGSVIAGMLAVKTAITEPKVDIIIISRNEKEARYFLKDKVLAVLNSLPAVEGIDWGTWEPYKDIITFSNGSTIESIPTSDDAARGRSAVRLIIMDEAGAIEHARDIWKSASPAIEKHPNGQMVVISNSKNGSWFNSMLKRIDEGRVMAVDLFFMNLWTDPARDQKWKDETKTQFDNEVDFYTEYPETIQHMFLQREGFVYPTFDSREGGKHVFDFEPRWNHRYIVGYDHGFEHYAVFLQMVWDPFEDILYVFDELYMHQKDVFDISGSIVERLRKWEDVGAPEVAWKRIADSSIFAHHGQKPISDLLKLYTDLTFQKSIKYNELGSMDMLRTRFTTDRIVIHPRCRTLIQQTGDLLYNKNGQPVDKDNDGPDVLKYICAELKQQLQKKPDAKPRAYDRKLNNYKKNGLILSQGGPSFHSENSIESWQKY
ncbi:MAG: terminase large subunit domain-containing protein [Candidatus Hodarchaeales archaeon]